MNYTNLSGLKCLYKIVIIFLVIILVSYKVNYNQSNEIQRTEKIHKYSKVAVVDLNDTKFILFYTKFYGSKDWVLPEDTNGASYLESLECPETRCILTVDRKLKPVDQFDAVVFSGINTDFGAVDKKTLQRSDNQFYIFAHKDTPEFNKFSTNAHFFNLTMSFKLNSDILWTYGFFRDKETGVILRPGSDIKWRDVDENSNNIEYLKKTQNKKQKVAWIASNCHMVSSHREQVVEKLKEYISVDVYGKCGKLKCDKSCRGEVGNKYKFYLSFENSMCEDYVTEKLFKTMEHPIIPVVLGAVNYTHYVPPKSFINAQDFATVKDLADYLNYLSENPYEYVKYFWWKKYYDVSTSEYQYCRLCEAMHDENILQQRKSYSDMHEWFNGKQCSKDIKIKYD